jgi:tetratricopeptide (TPR) repeat protein
MKKLYFILFMATISMNTFAQLDLPAAGGNPRATLSEEVGITSITIKYSRPDVNGREGKIWGNLVTYGFSTTNFVTNKNNSPWRAGANESTNITFEHDVKVEGKPLAAGTYGLFMAVWQDSVTVIFSKSTEAWGSFYYDDKQDALRVTVKPQMNDKSVEYLKYEFIEHKEKSCTIALEWEKLIVPFKVDVDVENTVVARLREQVTSQKGFNQLNLLSAAQYCINKGINLEEALAWSQRASGLKSYATLSNLANAYAKLNKMTQADSVLTEALTMANANQYAQLTRNLIGQKRADKALEIITAAKAKFGDNQAVLTSMAYAYSAKGDFMKAIDAATKALALAPNDAAKKTIQTLIDKLKENKDIN